MTPTRTLPTAVVPSEARVRTLIALALSAWIAVATLATAAGIFADSRVVFSLLVVFSIAVPIALYLRSVALRDWFGRLGLRALTLLHLWRVSAAFAFFWYAADGLLPDLFVRNAAWGDLIAGLLLGAVGLFALRPVTYWVAHGVGLIDFVVAVGTGLWLTFSGDPLMANISLIPIALIPLVLVPLSALTHIAAFDLLRRGAQP